MNTLISYYLLCSVVNGHKAHFVTESPATSKKVLSGPQIRLMLDESKGYVRVAETVIGGGRQHARASGQLHGLSGGQHARAAHESTYDGRIMLA